MDRRASPSTPTFEWHPFLLLLLLHLHRLHLRRLHLHHLHLPLLRPATTLVIWKRVITRFGKTVWISSPAFSSEPGVVETAGNLHSHLPCLDPRN